MVLNCCRGGSVVTDRGIAGLGPMLLRRGAAAVVAMRYEVTDDVAVRFADEFYRELFGGETPGRVDRAVESARVVVFQNPTGGSRRGFITPVLYLAPGGEQLFPLDRPVPPAPAPAGGAAAATGVEPPPSRPPARAALPAGLVRAVRERRCVPVLGPGLLAALAVREAPPPVPRNLIRSLADVSHYPEAGDFDLIERRARLARRAAAAAGLRALQGGRRDRVRNSTGWSRTRSARASRPRPT